ncbi:MAG: hypothetical protein AAGG44_06050 [Planctomycetota bacterium]
MSVITKNATTTLVNAAFLQEVKESNFDLWKLFNTIREMSVQEEPPREETTEWVSKLSELRDAVGLEFSLEETYGYVDGPSCLPNSHSTDASIAKSQHKELYLQLHEICEQAEEAQYRGTIARDMPIYMGAFEQFDENFRAHELFEHRLIDGSIGGQCLGD